ncbi:GNAT family N-acetyltransferase [Ornithinicoccus hortensis]|uniref:CelD/BcsL family acetyltransferase involved in cellulose biosynthesis n=1 Tax=Ornithinicoccus hortensis TaxID=82346 RepID=A0A542YLV0_9MICO|nr:GNAT family N-acetyltransferase [Ornithinicoccus hortensis]TQL49060.1 CelD/BcsL family acetyltransferase involved in cellulose biosynthesis [Ornithinicoccus hortensis]
MDTSIVRTAHDLSALREEWEHLETHDPATPFYVTHRFVDAWWQAYADAPGIELRVVVVRHNDQVVGIGPFSVRKQTRQGKPTRVLRWASHGDYMDVLLAPGAHRATVCREIVEAATRSDVQRVHLGNVRTPGNLANHLLKTDHNPEFTLHVENPFLDLTPYADLDDFVDRAGLPSHARKYRNKLFRERDVTFRVFAGNEDNILERLGALHIAEKDFLVNERSRKERHSLFEDDARTSLVRSIFENPQAAVTFGYEDADHNLLGYRTCFRHGRTLLSWNSAYHPDLDAYRLGKVIQIDILEHLLSVPVEQREVDIFDFGAGRYAWKFEWTDDFRPTYQWRRNLVPDAPPAPKATAPRKSTTSREPAPKAAVTDRSAKPSPAKSAELAARADAERQPGSPLRRAVREVRVVAQDTRSALRRRTNPPTIWYIPHPDDETIFMGGSIHRTRDRRNILVLLTRGGASTALAKVNAKLLDPLDAAGFMAGRGTEMAAALTELGVRSRNVVRHDLPDGSVDSDAVLDIIRDLATRYPRAEHRTMSYLDPHRDHAAAGRALRQAYREGIVSDAVFHLPVPLVRGDLGSRAPLGTRDVAAKRRALSQYQVWDPRRGRYAIGGTSVSKLIRDQLSNPTERVHGPDYEP